MAKVHYRKIPEAEKVRVRVRVRVRVLGLGLGLGLGIQSSPPWTFVIVDLCDSGPESWKRPLVDKK